MEPQIWSTIEKGTCPQETRAQRRQDANQTQPEISRALSWDFRTFEAQKKETRKRSGASVPKREARINAFLDARPDIDEKLKVRSERISISRFKALLRIGANADRAVWHAGDWHILP